MKKLSITTFVNLIFIFALVATATAFFAFFVIDKDRFFDEERHRHAIIAKTFLKDLKYFPSDEELREMYKSLSLKPIDEVSLKLAIINNGHMEHLQDGFLGRFRVFSYEGTKYLYIQKYGYNILLEDLYSHNTHWRVILIIASIAMLILIAIYIAILRKLSPLRALNIAIHRFSNGDFNATLEIEGNDEIARISKSFNKAKLHIGELLESKNLFMRNMLHELKTPITKGRILAEYFEDEAKKEKLIKTFEDMNTIITNLSMIEKISAKKYQIAKDRIALSDLIELASESLYLEVENVMFEGEEVEFEADLSLMVIALKNLMDNGIKFSDNQQVIVRGGVDKIEVLSHSPELKSPLEFYLEPFSQEKKNNKGFGLGLYIVHKIVQMHNFTLSYRYENGLSLFTIGLKA